MRLGAVTVVAALVLAGCATDDPPTVDGGMPRGAQPLPGPDGRFFAGLPLLPEATELSPPLRRHGVISQSFLARDATHRQVVDFYSDNLGDAQLVEVPGPIDNEWLRADWIVTDDRGVERRVRVATSDASSDQPDAVKYNLILYPDATPQLDDREDAEPSVDTEADP
jgi:hypothetical protein